MSTAQTILLLAGICIATALAHVAVAAWMTWPAPPVKSKAAEHTRKTSQQQLAWWTTNAREAADEKWEASQVTKDWLAYKLPGEFTGQRLDLLVIDDEPRPAAGTPIHDQLVDEFWPRHWVTYPREWLGGGSDGTYPGHENVVWIECDHRFTVWETPTARGRSCSKCGWMDSVLK